MSVNVARILHAGYLFESGETQIIFDPIFENPFSRNCFAFPSVRFDDAQIASLKPAAIFISHYHDDHCSFESLDRFDRRIPVYVFCLHDEMFSLIHELGFTDVRALQHGVAVRVGPFEVTSHPALDIEIDSILQIQAGDIKILNVVDSWIDPQTLERLARLAPWDLLLWPFQTMREIEVLSPSRAGPPVRELPPEWIQQIRLLRPVAIVPSSCQFRYEEGSWYNRAFFPIRYRQFEKEISEIEPRINVVRLDPGESVVLDHAGSRKGAGLRWVERLTDEVVDYDCDENPRPLTTSVIARTFPGLSAEAFKRVDGYLRVTLLRRLRDVGVSADPYFDDPRIWRLAIYDHNGDEINYYYKTNGPLAIACLDQEPQTYDWLTETPVATLDGALHRGESLTSMYVRINDMVFEPRIEKLLATADFLEDPLLRALFTGVFAQYQKAQLARIQARASGLLTGR